MLMPRANRRQPVSLRAMQAYCSGSTSTMLTRIHGWCSGACGMQLALPAICRSPTICKCCGRLSSQSQKLPGTGLSMLCSPLWQRWALSSRVICTRVACGHVPVCSCCLYCPLWRVSVCCCAAGRTIFTGPMWVLSYLEDSTALLSQ